MSPSNIETTILAACPMVGAMLTIGDGRPYNTALLVFDADSVGPYADQLGLADASPAALAAHPEMLAQISAGVAEGNAKLSRVEQIKRFRVLPTLWEPGGDEITLTMKLKRRPIADQVRYGDRGVVRRRTGPGHPRAQARIDSPTCLTRHLGR